MSDTSDLDESTTQDSQSQFKSSSKQSIEDDSGASSRRTTTSTPETAQLSSRTTSPGGNSFTAAAVASSSNRSPANSPTPGETDTDFEFIRSPSKRKYFRDNLVQTNRSNNPSNSQNSDKMTLSYPDDGKQERNEGNNFVPPQPVITYTHGIQDKTSKLPLKTHKEQETRLEATFVKDASEESPYQPTTTPMYTKLTFSSMEKFIPSSDTNIGNDVEKGGRQEESARQQEVQYKTSYLPDDNIQEAALAFLFSTFNLIFSVGIGYWYIRDGFNDEGKMSFAILIVAGLIIKWSFLFNRDIKVWNECKPIFLLAIIPFFTAFALSFADLIFTIKQANNPSYIRPWKNTRMVYFVESLILAFPQCVYHSMLMVENPNSLITLKGMIILVGLGILVLSIAFARIRYDSADKPSRFGSGFDKVLRCVIIASNKGLWVVTYVCAIVTVRLHFPSNQLLAVVETIVLLLVLQEIPIWISTIRKFENIVSRFSWLFFIIPQFIFLVSLIYWVNIDPGLYETNVGVCLLGAASMFESVVLMGWLLDSCNDREMDVMPAYPHFFGDLWTCGERRKFANGRSSSRR